jgi:hypothetical protein
MFHRSSLDEGTSHSVFFFPACFSDHRGANALAQQTASDTDKGFDAKVLSSGRYEVEASNLALQKASTQNVHQEAEDDLSGGSRIDCASLESGFSRKSWTTLRPCRERNSIRVKWKRWRLSTTKMRSYLRRKHRRFRRLQIVRGRDRSYRQTAYRSNPRRRTSVKWGPRGLARMSSRYLQRSLAAVGKG